MFCNLSREQSIDKNEIGMPCSICGYLMTLTRTIA